MQSDKKYTTNSEDIIFEFDSKPSKPSFDFEPKSHL